MVSLTNFDKDDKNKEYFKVMAWTTKLQEVLVQQALNDGISSYYERVKDSFDSLVEIAFVGACQYV